jgi:mRNA interferase RelE/StbE
VTGEPGAVFEIYWAAPAKRALRRLPEKVAAAAVEFTYGRASNPSRVGRPLRFELEGVARRRRV